MLQYHNIFNKDVNGRLRFTGYLRLYLFAVILFLPTLVKADEDKVTSATSNLPLHCDILQALLRGAGIYICTVVEHEPLLINDSAEFGKVTLRVNQTIWGKNQDTLILPYSFSTSRYRIPASQGWPNLQTMGAHPLLCVIVPNANCGFKVSGIDDCATSVSVMYPGNDSEMTITKAIIEIYKHKDTPEFGPALEKALDDDRIEVRYFAVEAILVVLGKTDPTEALKIIQSRVTLYKDDSHFMEAHGFITYILTHLDLVEPISPMNKFFGRSLIYFSKAESSQIRNDALNALANIIKYYHNSDSNYDLLNDLTNSEKISLVKALDKSEVKNEDTETRGSIHTIRKWIAQ
jgi:hypothetical protein